MVTPARAPELDSRGTPVYKPLTAEERQARRDQIETWRVTTLNWALEHANQLPLHGMPNCMRGVEKVEFVEHDVTGAGFMRISRGMNNQERLAELLQSTGYVRGHHAARETLADKLKQNWSGTDHEAFCKFVSAGGAAVVAEPEADGGGGSEQRYDGIDDGIGIDEVVVASAGAAGSW